MNFMHPIILAGAGTICGAAAVLVRSGIQKQRRRRAKARRTQLLNFCKRNELSMAGQPLRAELANAVHWYRGKKQEFEPENVMVGADREGSYFVARRDVCGGEHYVLGFEIRGELGIRGFHLEPGAPAKVSTRWMGWRKLWKGSASDLAPSAQLQLRWATGAAQFRDPDTRASVQRWLDRFAGQYDDARGRVLGLEIEGKRGWVHTATAIDVAALDGFLQTALEWRRAVLQELRSRPATVSGEVKPVNASGRHEALTGKKGDNQPLFPVPLAPGIELEDDGQTVRLSAEALLAELPERTQHSKRSPKRRVFEIPEPEEEVVLIRGQ